MDAYLFKIPNEKRVWLYHLFYGTWKTLSHGSHGQGTRCLDPCHLLQKALHVQAKHSETDNICMSTRKQQPTPDESNAHIQKPQAMHNFWQALAALAP